MSFDTTINYLIPKALREKTDESIDRIDLISTELKRAKEKLHEERQQRRLSQKRFEHSFHHAPIAKAIVAPDGTWLEVNSRLCEMLGRSREELMGLTFQDVTKPADIKPDVELVRKMLAGEITSYKMPKAYIHKKGHEVPVGLYVTLIKTPIGEPLYFVSQIVSEDMAKEVLDFINGARDGTEYNKA